MVRRWYGLDGAAETLEAISQDFGLTRERVRQIIKRSTDKLYLRFPRDYPDLVPPQTQQEPELNDFGRFMASLASAPAEGTSDLNGD